MSKKVHSFYQTTIRAFKVVYTFLSSNKYVRRLYYSALVIYAIYFVLHYSRHGLNTISLLTNLFLPLYVVLLIGWLSKVHILSPNFASKIRYVTIIYLIVEAILVLIRPSSIYHQHPLGLYYSDFEKGEKAFYKLKFPKEEYSLQSSEFNFSRTANSLGIPDVEWSMNKDTSTTRILCIGDSFTEGDGADFDSTYVAFLNRSLQSKNPHIEVMNAGRCGSDPFFDFKLLQNIMIEYQPDIIIQSFTINDLYYDMLIKGGNERFLPDSTLKFRPDYWWEPIYAASFTARILIQSVGGFDKNLHRIELSPENKLRMEQNSKQLFKDYQDFAQKHQAQLVVFTLPFIENLKGSQENEEFYNKFKKEFADFGISFHNLHPCYEDYIAANNSIYKDYYWKTDGHHNAKGYEMMAKCIEDILLIDSTTRSIILQ